MKVENEYYVFKNNGEQQTNIKLIDWCKKWETIGVNSLLITSITNDGMKNGYDIELYNLLNIIKIPIIASGGCGSTNDIYNLITLTHCRNVLIASLFHYNITTPKEIKEEVNMMQENAKQWIKKIDFKKHNLVPVIVQDYNTNEVLMLAYTNKEAFSIMINEKRTCFYSRSRKKIWKKGEISGNIQLIKEIRYDCDNDTLLAIVEQKGNACHLNKKSCFDNNYIVKDDDLKAFNPFTEINRTINAIRKQPIENSYTNYLLDKGVDKISKKLIEEAAETIIAAKNNDKKEIIYEMSDLLYHMIVLMNYCNISYSDICNELQSRSYKSCNRKKEVI